MEAPSPAEFLEDLTGYNVEEKFIASRYTQGTRTVYSLDLSLTQISALIPAPSVAIPTEGNRRVREGHARAFGDYIRENEDWISPSLLLRAPNIFRFEKKMSTSQMEFGILSFSRLLRSDLRILDGQHRILGIHAAMATLSESSERKRAMLAEAEANHEPDEVIAHVKNEIAELDRERERFARERIAVQIIVEDNPSAYQQMFYDIADNALGITASVRARFDSRRITNRSLEYVMQHKLLRGRVDLEQDRISGSNPNLMGVKHVAEIVRILAVGIDGRIGRKVEDTLEEGQLVATSKAFFDTLVGAFPDLRKVMKGTLAPDELRKGSLLASASMFKALAGTYYMLAAEGWSQREIERYFATLAKEMSAPVGKDSIWMETHVFGVDSYAPRARRQDLRKLVNWLRRRARKAEPAKAASKTTTASAAKPRMETLHCEPGDHEWEREFAPGRKPAACPVHRAEGQQEQAAA